LVPVSGYRLIAGEGCEGRRFRTQNARSKADTGNKGQIAHGVKLRSCEAAFRADQDAVKSFLLTI
jgi:hypothetical protein